MRQMNIAQLLIALAVLGGITVLGLKGTVDGDAILAIYSAIIGAVLAGGGASLANGITVSTYERGHELGHDIAKTAAKELVEEVKEHQ